jgi:hypothetical protein
MDATQPDRRTAWPRWTRRNPRRNPERAIPLVAAAFQPTAQSTHDEATQPNATRGDPTRRDPSGRDPTGKERPTNVRTR